MSSRALIALGANLPGPGGEPPLKTCRRVAAMLDGVLDGRLAAVSRWYATAPIPVSDQPPYLNGIVLLEFADDDVDPAELLAALMGVEAACGRERGVPNAARTLDLDLIALKGPKGPIVREAPDPILPHPRAHLRAFVLAPILDVEPDWIHPVSGRSARDLLAALDPQDCRALSDA
jgi:2-amino-4-hydroxy-6-hydroxymethyldihydropteridine diphosphokinase